MANDISSVRVAPVLFRHNPPGVDRDEGVRISDAEALEAMLLMLASVDQG